jgi:endonuclease/exonuclease/phosphatase family metal-dependent hydrolase
MAVVAFPKPPPPSYDYDVERELAALRDYPKQPEKEDRAIPPKAKGRLLMATWNVANLGVQRRRPKDYRLIAEIISWFDLIAIQETNDDLSGLQGIRDELPGNYEVIFSDPGGNYERFAFVYDPDKVSMLEEVGHVTVPPSDFSDVKLPGVTQTFSGFDRNPYLVAFEAGRKRFVAANVHLYFGDDDSGSSIERRCLEAYAVARWADLRRKNKHAYVSEFLACGDFNLPVMDKSDPIYSALTKRGLTLPPHHTKVGGTNVLDDQQFDQVAVFPGMAAAIEDMGVFDFDGAVFKDLWGPAKREHDLFVKYVKYYLSDHRPLWAALRLDG